jgi:class 3 adenylate cyclase
VRDRSRGGKRQGEPHHEVRKTVTVVFVDVTGSTALGERLDPERVRRVMRSYFAAMREILERHGGSVEKFIGDAVMASSACPPSTRTTRCAPVARRSKSGSGGQA